MSLQDYAPIPDTITINTPKESYEELISKGMELRELLDVSRWTIGDFAYKVSHDLGNVADDKGYTPLDKVAIEIGIKPMTLQQYKWVSSKFPTEKARATNLSWTHYRHAASTSQPDTWITKAVNENLTSSQLKNQIEEASDKIAIRAGKPCYQCANPLPENHSVTVKWGKQKWIFCSWECATKHCNNNYIEEIKEKAKVAV